jgi:16S rRNA (guanine966-N2)-methyltransferase
MGPACGPGSRPLYGAVRVIAGSLGGRRLAAPAGATTRPTSDRVREAIFNILGAPPTGARVLDLFAGAGGLGIEALSRGAAHADFVDQSRAAIACLRGNLAALGLAADRARVRQGDATRVLADLARGAASTPGAGFDWLFIDPPYASELVVTALTRLGEGEICRPGAVVVAEHDRRRVLDPSYGALARTDERRYGDTSVSFYRRPEP